jgi:hypothetical protein
MGLEEIKRSFSKKAFVRNPKRLVPEIRVRTSTRSQRG